MASRSDITVDPATARWNLVQERASEAIAELLLLFFFVILLVVRPLRSLVENTDHFDHETVLLCPAQDKASKPMPLAAPISTAPMIVPTISRIPAIPTAPKTPVAVPVSTPGKKPSIRPIAVNPLKVIPSTQTVDLGIISLGSYKIIPPPSKLQSALSDQSSSSNPTSSESLPELPSDPSLEPSSLFGSLFSSELSSSTSSTSLSPSVVQLSGPSNVRPLSETPTLDPYMRDQLERHFTISPRKDLLELFIEVRQERLRLERELHQAKSASLPPALASLVSPPTSPSSRYVPPHLRPEPKSSPSDPPSDPPSLIPPIGPPFITRTTIIKGCFYCHNKYKDENGLYPPHCHRNKCPWFQHHLAVGTCHLNDLGELCLGPRLVGRQAIPLPFWNSKISQGEQVKRRTDGTEYDEVLANRLRNPIVFKH
jgi:hypothetical protein